MNINSNFKGGTKNGGRSNEYIRQSEIDPTGLLTMTDITAEVDEAIAGIRKRIDNMFNIILSKDCPDITIGNQCKEPYKCPLKEECWDFLPENNIFNLYRAKVNRMNYLKKVFMLSKIFQTILI